MLSLPEPRGELTEALFTALRAPVHTLPSLPVPDADDVLRDEDLQLALYCSYELHYRGLPDVDDAWEWEPSLLALRRSLEERLEDAVLALAGPRAPEEVQTLSAENRPGGSPSFLMPCPMTACDDPYMGEESIRRPPASKKARITSAQASRAAGSSPTLKVIQLPSPTMGTASPLDGIGLVRSGPCRVAPAEGRRSAARAPTAPREPNSMRRSTDGDRGIGCWPPWVAGRSPTREARRRASRAR